MGMGQMTIPLYLTTIPEGMSLTITSITPTVPPNFWAYITNANGIKFPHTFTSAEVASGYPNNRRGAKIAELLLRTDGFGFSSGNGGSFLVSFTITGRPNEFPDAEYINKTGTISVGTSQWGTFSRPDQTNFAWTIDGRSNTFTAKTPTLSYLDDSCIAIAYAPDQKTYVFGVTNQSDWIQKLMKGAVGGIIAGHKAVWSAAAGAVCSIGGVAFAVVSFGASYIDGI